MKIFLIFFHLFFFLVQYSNGQLAKGHSKFLGNRLGTSSDGAQVRPNFSDYWNQFTPGNSGKWERVEPTRDQMDWDPLDTFYDYTRTNNFPFKHHTLVWGNQEPSWLADLSDSDKLDELKEFMRLVFQRYPNMELIDVVNEPLHEYPSTANALGGSGSTGWDWVIEAYRLAKQYRDQYAPNCKLLINDYDILKSTSNTNNYKTIVQLLKDRNLVDGIGCQAHFLENTNVSTIEANLNHLDDLGLPIYISEYDVNRSNDDSQKDIYEIQFPVFWEHPAVEGITLWGYEEDRMWRDDAYLIRSDGSERPALQWLRTYLQENSQWYRVENDGRDYWLQASGSTDQAYTAPQNKTGNFTQWKKVTAGGEWFYLDSRGKNGYRLQDDGGTTKMVTTANHGGYWVQWKQVNAGSGYYRLQNRASGKWLQASGADNGTYLTITNSTGPWTKWKFVETGSSSSKVANSSDKLLLAEAVEENGWLVYPNPSSTTLNVKNADKAFSTLILRDIQGKTLIRREITAREALDVSGLSEGLYFLELLGKRANEKRKILIER